MEKQGGAVRRTIERKSDTGHYFADVAVVWCFDDRFSDLLSAWKQANGFTHIDTIKVAGGIKGLSSPVHSYETNFILLQIEKSLKLHNPPQIVLMAHSRCGDYGKEFADKAEEQNFYFGELDRAEIVVENFLKDKHHEVQILKYFADFDGILERS